MLLGWALAERTNNQTTISQISERERLSVIVWPESSCFKEILLLFPEKTMVLQIVTIFGLYYFPLMCYFD